MNRRIVTIALALAFSATAASASYAAVSPKGIPTPVTGTNSGKVKFVSFHLRNDSGSPLTLKAGEQQITVEPGKTANLKLQEGTQVVAVNATAHVNAGAILTTVSQMLSGNTLAVS